jgi:conjugal transfer pilus assembly protein TraB
MLWLLLVSAGLALAALVLMPASSPRAAIADDTPANAAPDPNLGTTNFGAATPTEKFVQSFQQQVSQQLQAALAQSSDAQESRLRTFEQQQRELNEHLQSVEQAIASTRSEMGALVPGNRLGATPSANGADTEPPRVNARRITPQESPADASGGGPSWFQPGGSQNADHSSSSPVPAINSGHDSSALLAGDSAPAPTGLLTSTRLRSGEPNIAPHGFVEGRLLNGVVAIQGGPERDSIVALSGSYQSANGFLSDLDGCFALVQGRPEIASGRIDFKLSRLTCNFADGASRTWDASGWLVDADGIRGVRAVIVDNTARKAAVAAAGGAISGVGQRISQQQYQINSGPVGYGSSSSFTGNAGRDAIGGAASGAAGALGQSIADYYNLYSPSLQVGGGTHVTVVLANDLRLPPSARDMSQTHTAVPQ